MRTGTGRRDRFGSIAAVAALAMTIAVLVLIAAPLDRWLDTALVLLWLFVPGIVASVLYQRIEDRDGWRADRPLNGAANRAHEDG